MRLLALLLVVIPSLAHADLRVSIRNDVFTDLTPPIDDNGFTHDFDVHFYRPYREYVVGVRLVDRWVTEDTQFGGIRRDLLDLLATGERTFGEPDTRELTPSVRIGPTFTGNLGGKVIQNGFHTACYCGRKLSEGLQDTYEEGNEVGLVAAARVRGSIGIPLVQAYAFTDGRASLGTGVSAFETAGGGRLDYQAGSRHFGAHVEVAVMRVHLVDEGFVMKGSYRSGWQFGWRAGVHYASGRLRFEYEYRANEDGSGEPIGVVSVTIRQAGLSF